MLTWVAWPPHKTRLKTSRTQPIQRAYHTVSHFTYSHYADSCTLLLTVQLKVTVRFREMIAPVMLVGDEEFRS